MNKPSTLQSVMTSVNRANGLPNAHYIDPVVFAEERASVLFASWSGVGFGKDIPEPAMPSPWISSACRSCWCAIRTGPFMFTRTPAATAG